MLIKINIFNRALLSFLAQSLLVFEKFYRIVERVFVYNSKVQSPRRVTICQLSGIQDIFDSFVRQTKNLKKKIDKKLKLCLENLRAKFQCYSINRSKVIAKNVFFDITPGFSLLNLFNHDFYKNPRKSFQKKGHFQEIENFISRERLGRF